MTVYDADSRWGTLVNGQLTGCRELKPGDRITVGETELQLELEGSPNATTLARPSDCARKEDESASLASVSVDALAGDDMHARAGATPESDGRELVGDVAQLVGTRFARFEVESVVARAQTGVVFRAAEADENRTVALKVFYAENFGDAHNMQRFLRAVRTMLPVRHENLVALYHAGRSQGLCYTASEFVEGESAAEMTRRIGIGGMLEWQHAFRIAVDVARALESHGEPVWPGRRLSAFFPRKCHEGRAAEAEPDQALPGQPPPERRGRGRRGRVDPAVRIPPARCGGR